MTHTHTKEFYPKETFLQKRRNVRRQTKGFEFEKKGRFPKSETDFYYCVKLCTFCRLKKKCKDCSIANGLALDKNKQSETF